MVQCPGSGGWRYVVEYPLAEVRLLYELQLSGFFSRRLFSSYTHLRHFVPGATSLFCVNNRLARVRIHVFATSRGLQLWTLEQENCEGP